MEGGTIAIFVILGLVLIVSLCLKVRDIKRSKLWVVDPDRPAKSKFSHHCRCKYKESIPWLEANGKNR